MRKPDLTIGENYLERWYVLPRNHYFNIYLHKFSGSDDDRALHDHPWSSVSFLLKGHMIEHSTGGIQKWIPWLLPVFRRAQFAHRLEIMEGPVWTLFITGPKVREWGFLCPRGWKHWSLMTNKKGQTIGGCE